MGTASVGASSLEAEPGPQRAQRPTHATRLSPEHPAPWATPHSRHVSIPGGSSDSSAGASGCHVPPVCHSTGYQHSHALQDNKFASRPRAFHFN